MEEEQDFTLSGPNTARIDADLSEYGFISRIYLAKDKLHVQSRPAIRCITAYAESLFVLLLVNF